MEIKAAWAELGLKPGADLAEVKRAWRLGVSRWHPDRNDAPDALARVQRINMAYERLCQLLQTEPLDDDADDPATAEAAQPSPPPPDHPAEAADTDTDADAAEPGDDDRDGPHGHPGAQHQAPPRGGRRSARPMQRRVQLSLEEAAQGCVKTVRGRVTEVCLSCDGQGYHVLDHDCPSCEGSGQVRQRTWYGWGAVRVDCEDCGGTGRARQVCAACDGLGRFAERPYRVKVRLPAGVRDGDWLTVPGRADLPEHPASDLNLQVRLRPHPLFTLADDGNLLLDMPVDGLAWLTQRWVDVPGLGGWQQMRLQREHLSYRLRGQGFPARGQGPRADLIVQIQPVFPAHWSAEQEALLNRLIALNAELDAGPLTAWRQRLQDWQAEPAPAPEPRHEQAERRRARRQAHPKPRPKTKPGSAR